MDQKLNGIKVAILVADGFEQVELTEPKKALEEAGAKTFIVSPKKDKVKGWNHDKPADDFTVDILVNDANASDYDALLLPGGVMNPDTLRMDQFAVDFVKKFNESHKSIAAICHGPWTLINANAVAGKAITSYPSIKQDLINAGAKWIDMESVTDGNIVTSRNPHDIPAFNKAMIELFSKK